MTVKFIDLFCGIGGFHLGLSSFDNHECVFSCDIDVKCREVYSKNFGINPHDDITKLNIESIPKHDVLCAGFPCQPFSTGGKKLGLDDKRGNLFNYIVNIMKIHKPKIAMLENVKHIKTISDGLVYNHIYNSLKSIGYSVFDILISPDEIGVPQNRERIIFIVIRNDYYNNSLKDNIINSLKINKTNLKNNPVNIFDNNPDKKYNICQELIDVIECWNELLNNITPLSNVISPININYFNINESTTFTVSKNKEISLNNNFYQTNKLFIDKWYSKWHLLLNKKCTYKKLEYPTTLYKYNIDSHIKINIFNQYIQLRPSGIRVKFTDKFPSLVAMVQIPIYGNEKRYLTPQECMALQSFPKNFDFNNQKDNMTYKQLGNSVNVDVVYVVYKSIIENIRL